MATKKAALLSELQNKSGSHCAEGDFDIAVCMPMMGVLMERHHIPTTNGNRALLSLCAFFSMCFSGLLSFFSPFSMGRLTGQGLVVWPRGGVLQKRRLHQTYVQGGSSNGKNGCGENHGRNFVGFFRIRPKFSCAKLRKMQFLPENTQKRSSGLRTNS